ncbi:MAG: Druantia anti-phage system protein DruA [Bacillota bacterium]
MMQEGDFPRLVQGRMITLEDLYKVRRLITDNPQASRHNLAALLCHLWEWYSPAGKIKLKSARELLDKLHNAGLIALPPLRQNSKVEKVKQQTLFLEPPPTRKRTLQELLPLSFEVVTAKNKSALWNELIERYHYLASSRLFGARMRYLVYSGDEIIAALGFSAAAWQIEPRDRFIGWDQNIRRSNLQLIVNNSRFLILPWIKCQNLVSTLLSQVIKRLPDDWERTYGYRPVLLETFVDGEKFGGTSYIASNWIYVGFTKGKGRQGKGKKRIVSEKDVFLYPLQKDFRERLVKEPEE